MIIQIERTEDWRIGANDADIDFRQAPCHVANNGP